MAETPQHNISPGQLFGIILSAQMGIGILALPRIIAIEGGHAGWWFILPIGLLTFLGTLLVLNLCKRAGGSIILANQRILGKYVGLLFNLLILGLLIITSIVNFTYFTQTLELFFFKQTPLIVIAAFIYIPAFYIVLKGLKILGRFDSFVFFAVFMILAVALIVYKRIKWSFLFPLTEVNLSKTPAILGELAFSFIGFDLLLLFYPWIRGSDGKVKLAAFGASFCATSISLFFTIIIIGLFGEGYIHRQVFPIINLIRSIELPVLERLDIYFIGIWLPAMGTSATAFLAATQLAAVETFPKISYKTILWILSIIVVGTQILLNKFDLLERVAYWVGILELFGFGLLLPLILLPIAWIRGIKP